MQDMQGDGTSVDLGADAARPAVAESDHAAIIRLLNSETWTRRLEEARQSRNRILAQKQRPVSAPVFRPAVTQRVSRQDRLPPLEPAVPLVVRAAESSAPPAPERGVPERGVVVQFQPPGAAFHPPIEPAEISVLEMEASAPDLSRVVQITLAFVTGIGLGLVLSALI